MVKRVLYAALFLAAGLAYAQPTPIRHPPLFTYATVPACSAGEAKLYAISDSGSCTSNDSGTGVICQCVDGTVSEVGSGGSGGVSDGDKGDITVSGSGAAWAIDADSVALGTDTTGGYAASVSEGGPATTATALAADPADCSANQFANAIAASGALTCSALADADIPDTITASSYVPITLDGQQTITATGAGNDITQTAADTIVFEIAGAKSLVMASDSDTLTLTSTGASDSEANFVAANVANPNSYAMFGAYSEDGASYAYLRTNGDSTPEIRADEASGMVLVYNGPFRPRFSSDPPASCSGTIDGSLFVDSDTHLLNYCDGSSWGNVRDGGAAATATALAANGANCSAGQYSRGVDTSGAAEDCTADDDVPDSGDFGALALSGDVSSSGLTTTIGTDKITESMLKAVDTASDEECLTYETTTGDFEWQSCGSGGIGGSTGSTDDAPLCADGTGGATAGACTQLAAPAGSAGAPAYSFSADPDTGWYRSGTNSMSFAANGAQQFTLGPFVFTFNVGAVVTGGGGSQIYGFQHLVEAKTNGSGSPYAIPTSRGQEVFTNETTTAKTYLTLPSAAGGYTFTFIVQDADGLRVTAGAGDDIHLGATVSTTAGYCESTTVGDSITIVAINATSYYATAIVGSGWSCS